MSLLLNQVGTPANNGLGYGDNGFSVSFTDAATYSIHNYQDHSPVITGGVVQGTWKPDGPGLGLFNGATTTGTWSLYLADKSPGGVMTLNSWELQVQTVSETPEPSALSLFTLGGLLLIRRRVGKR